MIDLFSDDELLVQPDASDYLISATSGTVASARFRSPEMKHEVRHLLRSLLSRFATPRTEFAVADDTGAHRFDIVSGQGHGTAIDLTVTEASGALVGTVATAGGSFNPFPKIVLSDAWGQPVGHMTTKGALHAYDVTDREVASVVVGATKPAFGKVRYELTFLGSVSPQAKVLILAGLIGWDLTR